MSKKRILIFTDSRGQHKPAGQTHDIFAERLAKDDLLDVDMYLCPMKWTSTVDFLEQFPKETLAQYDHVILYTGIVDWSPRPAKNASNDLYDSKTVTNTGNMKLNSRDYSKKVINNKKSIFDSIFGEKAIKSHLATPMETEYEGQKTNNMYSLEMAKHSLLPKLLQIKNLIFVSANRFVPGWEGDFKRGRPDNIRISEAYSDLFTETLCAHNIPVVDLRAWNATQVKRFTCDNIHLTEEGSDFIYARLMEHMSMIPKEKTKTVDFDFADYQFTGFPKIERITGAKKGSVLKAANCEDEHLATLIIGVRHSPSTPERIENLRFLLKWIDFHYSDLYDVLLFEQDSEQRITLDMLDAKPYVRHAFGFNPKEYNRGWGYNVAVKHHCQDSKVIALMDTDVLTGANFLRDTMDCHSKMDVVSPYLNIYYTDKDEARKVSESFSLETLDDSSKIKNPVTVAGGIVIWSRKAYMAIRGFEQYVGYSCEDRAMDVMIFNHIHRSRIRISPQTYVHMFHETDDTARKDFKEIYGHLTSNYGCKYDPNLTPFDFIHKNCEHVAGDKTLDLMMEREADFGDKNLYQSCSELKVNGIRQRKEDVVVPSHLTLPPEFAGLDDYHAREVYSGTPAPDSKELAKFHNKYLGKRCFIIGNGPSLNNHDLSLLEGEYSFGVNSFYYKTRETGFRPTFYVVEDSSVMKENINEIRKYEAPYKFFPTIYSSIHPKEANTFFFEMNRGFYEKTSPNYAIPRFSTDATKELFCGQSVTYINLQLAYFMGFSEVYLIGMDFDYVIPKSHKRTGDVLLSDTDDENHFHKDYFGKGKTWKDPKLDRVLINYRMADLAFTAGGRKIYNATVGGKLEVFDRVSFEQLLRDPVTRAKRKVEIDPEVNQRASLDRQHGLEPANAVPRSMSDTGYDDLTLGARLRLTSLTSKLLNECRPGIDVTDIVEIAETEANALASDDEAVVHFRKVRDWIKQ